MKNRHFQVKIAKDQETPDTECTRAHIDAHEIHNLATQQVKHVAFAVAGVILVTAASKTLSEVIVHTAKTYIK